MLKHIFHITFWKDWKTPLSPAPSRDNFKRLKPVQSDWASYRYQFMVNHTLRSLSCQTEPSEVFIYVEPHYLDEVNQYAILHPLPSIAKIITQPLDVYAKENFTEYDYLSVTRIDSDDLFHKDVAKEVKAQPTTCRRLIYQDGFVYDTNKHTIARYTHPTPPFYTDIYPRSDIENNKAIMQKDHTQATVGIRKLLSPGKFVVLCHAENQQCTTNFKSLLEISKKFSYLGSRSVSLPVVNLAEFGCDGLVIGG